MGSEEVQLETARSWNNNGQLLEARLASRKGVVGGQRHHVSQGRVQQGCPGDRKNTVSGVELGNIRVSKTDYILDFVSADDELSDSTSSIVT